VDLSQSSKKPNYVSLIHVPLAILQETLAFLRVQGYNLKEGMVFWSGGLIGKDEARITRCIIPEQITTLAGVRVPLDSAFKISVELSEKKEFLFVQVHSHPSRSFHSTIDNYNPITDKPGFFSIVVPNYGKVEPYDLFSWCINEYDGFGIWKELTSDEVRQRFVIEDDYEGSKL